DEGATRAIEWLAKGGPGAEAAAEALLQSSLRRSLVDPERRLAARSAIRAMGANLSASMVRLLAAVGDDDDIAFVGTLLTSQRAPVRVAAAESLMRFERLVDALIGAAHSDPALAGAAIDALALHAPNAERLSDAISLAGLRAEEAPSLMLRFLDALPPSELLYAVNVIPERQVAMEAALRSRRLAEVYSDAPDVVERLLIACASMQWRREDAAGALRTLSAAGFEEGEAATEAERIRTLALIELDRLDEASAIGSGVPTWMEGLERCVDRGLGHASRVAERIESEFGDALTSDERARLQRLASRVSRADPDGGEANAEQNATLEESG
ncbi:MAG: hypothetical protein VYC34_09875, partial [Planctomycetota bacterium]|nr:hypothetical protein [Planctomycetota bacterium]